MSTRSITAIHQTDNGVSKSEVTSKDDAMQELRDELLAIEDDRLQGRSGCTIDELDLYLDDVIAEV